MDLLNNNLLIFTICGIGIGSFVCGYVVHKFINTNVEQNVTSSPQPISLESSLSSTQLTPLESPLESPLQSPLESSLSLETPIVSEPSIHITQPTTNQFPLSDISSSERNKYISDYLTNTKYRFYDVADQIINDFRTYNMNEIEVLTIFKGYEAMGFVVLCAYILTRLTNPKNLDVYNRLITKKYFKLYLTRMFKHFK